LVVNSETAAAESLEEEPLTELPQPYLSPRARAAEKEKAAAAAAVMMEEKPPVRKLPQTGPLRQTGPLGPLPQTSPLTTAEQAAASTEVEALLARIYQNPQDHAARLDLARTYWATGNREGAYAEYLELVNAGEFTKETMADLETIVEIHDQTDWHRMLGDVYMKIGRLSSALEQYRRALSEV
jgi:thioredoxin-like negative regulator of GroEL